MVAPAKKPPDRVVTAADDEWWTIQEYADRNRCSVTTVRRRISAGKLKARPSGRTFLIHSSVIVTEENAYKAPDARRTPPAKPVRIQRSAALWRRRQAVTVNPSFGESSEDPEKSDA